MSFERCPQVCGLAYPGRDEEHGAHEEHEAHNLGAPYFPSEARCHRLDTRAFYVELLRSFGFVWLHNHSYLNSIGPTSTCHVRFPLFFPAYSHNHRSITTSQNCNTVML